MKGWFEAASSWIVPLLLGGIPLLGALRGVRVYEAFVAGAREGFETAVRILPYMVAMFAAVSMLRESGLLELLLSLLSPFLRPLGVPEEVLLLGLLRPLSGSGSLGYLSELLKTHGADSAVGLLASTAQGSTETTFYILAVYFGAAGVRKTGHALAVALLADLAGFAAAVWIVRRMLL